jgi:hypothetical protein
VIDHSLLTAGVLTHLGAFSLSFCAAIIEMRKTFLKGAGIVSSAGFTIAGALGNTGLTRD